VELFNSMVLLEIVTEYLCIMMGWGGGSFIVEKQGFSSYFLWSFY